MGSVSGEARMDELLLNVTTKELELEVDYGKTITELKEEGKYNFVSNSITEENFPKDASKKGKVKLKAILVCVHKDATLIEVNAILDRENLRGGDLRELMTFGVAYPDEQRKAPVVASNARWAGSGDDGVPFLVAWYGERELNLGGRAHHWSSVLRNPLSQHKFDMITNNTQVGCYLFKIMKFIVYENYKRIVTYIKQKFNITISIALTGRPRKIEKLDALALALYKHASGRNTKISLYRDLCKTLRCSYKTFVVAINESGLLALRILFILMRLNKKDAHLIKYTDSTDIPVCLKKNADKHKTMSCMAGFGRSSKGWYYGLKMTMTRDYHGRILGLKFTPPGMNDRDIFREINQDIMGILVADAGYVSKELETDMHIDGKRWTLIRPYKTMKKLATLWQLWIYRGRFKIEFDFRSLKLFFGLVTSMPKSINGYLSNYMHALLAYALRV